MKLLVVGGSRFVGRHVVEAALAQGHEVSTFNRGTSAPGLFGDRVEELHGDRKARDVTALRHRPFEAVIDATAYHPRDVEVVLHALADPTVPYALVSTVSVYAEPIAPGSDEEAPVVELGGELPQHGDSRRDYGGLKVRCERAAPAHAVIVRPGVVAGPYDPTERVTRWARRAGEGDELLAGDPEQPVQFIDARDLAAFLLHGIDSGAAGTFNAVTEPIPFSGFLAAAGAADRVAWVGRQQLTAAGVELWKQLPMTATREEEGFLTLSSARGRAAGLRTRPPAETLADVRAWDSTRPACERHDPFPARRERQLLASLERRMN